MATSIQDIITDAITDFENEYEAEMQYPEDLCAEIADSAVPLYTNEIIEVGTSDHSLMTDEPELGSANGSNFSGENNVINIIAANIYEKVSNALYARLYKLQQEEDELATA